MSNDLAVRPAAVVGAVAPAPSAAAGSAPLIAVLAAWTRYDDLRAAQAPLAERLAAWGAFQDVRRPRP